MFNCREYIKLVFPNISQTTLLHPGNSLTFFLWDVKELSVKCWDHLDITRISELQWFSSPFQQPLVSFQTSEHVLKTVAPTKGIATRRGRFASLPLDLLLLTHLVAVEGKAPTAPGLGGADAYLTEVWEQLKPLENEVRVDLMVEIIMSQVPWIFGWEKG